MSYKGSAGLLISPQYLTISVNHRRACPEPKRLELFGRLEPFYGQDPRLAVVTWYIIRRASQRLTPKWVERRKRQTSPWDLPIRDERSGSGRCRAAVPMWRKLMHLPAPPRARPRASRRGWDPAVSECRHRGLPTSPGPSHPPALLDARSHNLFPHLLHSACL